MTSELLNSAMGACGAAKHYHAMFQSLKEAQPLKFAAEDRVLSKALFFHLAKMKYAGWQHRVDFQRARKHSMADLFQDLVAFYLRCALPTETFNVLLEPRLPGEDGKTIHPDILIQRKEVKRKAVNHFAIEVKTTIGYARPRNGEEGKYERLETRLREVSEAANVPLENVIYIFEEPTNVTREFCDFFWDQKERQAKDRSRLPFPLSQIFPLFWKTDPYYWERTGIKNSTKGGSKDRRSWYPEISDEEFLEQAAQRIVTPLEDILTRIANAKSSRTDVAKKRSDVVDGGSKSGVRKNRRESGLAQ
ncbi:hypothetical protein [Cupriavidus necator]|nr:hypothetical protein [Cupriavidus necator]